MRSFASGAKPGRTRDAWKSSNSFPPNSRYSLLSNWLMRVADVLRTAFSGIFHCQIQFSWYFSPFFPWYLFERNGSSCRMMQSFPHWVLKSYKQLILFYYREKSRARKKCGRNRSDSEKALLRASMIRDFSGISHGSESLQKKSPQKERGRELG